MAPTDDELFALAARHWPIADAVLSAPGQGTNNLIRVVSTDRPVATLRIYRNLDHDRVVREHRLLRRLAAAGLSFRVPRPWPTSDGVTLIESPWGPVGLLDWIDGRRPDLGHADAARAAGRALAELDQALAAVPVGDAPFDWLGPDLGVATIDLDLVAALADAGLARAQVEWLRARAVPPVRPPDLPVQVIHTDPAAGNFLVDDASGAKISGILDFEVAGRDLRINDLVSLLFQSTALDGPDWPATTAALAGGYAEVITPDPAEIMIIPSLIAARALGSVGWRATRWRTGLDAVSEVVTRITGAQRTERWLEHHGDHLLDVLHRCFTLP